MNYTKHPLRPQPFETGNQLQKEKAGRTTDMWQLNNMLLNNNRVTEGLEKKKNEDDQTARLTVWESAQEAVVRGKSVSLQDYPRKQSQKILK